MEIMEIFAWNMKKYRDKKDISQAKLAEMCKSSTSYFGELEICNRKPSMEMIDKIAKALDIEPFRLFVDDNERLKNEPDVSDYLEGLTTIERQDLLERIMSLISCDLKKVLQPEKRG